MDEFKNFVDIGVYPLTGWIIYLCFNRIFPALDKIDATIQSMSKEHSQAILIVSASLERNSRSNVILASASLSDTDRMKAEAEKLLAELNTRQNEQNS